MKDETPQHPGRRPDYPWLFQTRAKRSAKILFVCVTLGMVVPLFSSFALMEWLLQHSDTPGPEWKRLCLIVMFCMLIWAYRVTRWRLCVEPAGVWARTVIGWSFGAWEEPIIDQDLSLELQRDAALREALAPIAPHRRAPFRWLLSTSRLAASDRRRVMDIHSDHVSPTPLPEPVEEVEIQIFAALDMSAQPHVRADDHGMTCRTKQRREVHLPWDEIAWVELIVSDHCDPVLLGCRVGGTTGVIEAGDRLPVERLPSMVPDLFDIDPCLKVIAALRRYLPHESLIVTAMEGRARNIHEARRRVQEELRQLRADRKRRRTEAWLMTCVALIFIFAWGIYIGPDRAGTVAESIALAAPSLALVLLLYVALTATALLTPPALLMIWVWARFCRSTPRRGLLYREYQRHKAQMGRTRDPSATPGGNAAL